MPYQDMVADIMRQYGLAPAKSGLAQSNITIKRNRQPDPEPATPQIGTVQQELEQGLGDQALETGLGGLGHLGDALDAPGAFVRGVLGAGTSLVQGDFAQAGQRALSALPFSESIGGSEYRAPTGQDLMQDWGADQTRTMDEERRIRIAMMTGMSEFEAVQKFTTEYEEQAMSDEMRTEFANIMQRALEIDPELKTGVTQADISKATTADDFMGFAMEIALDPLTYLTLGASAAGKAGHLVTGATKAAKIAHGVGKVGDDAAKGILSAFKQADTLDDAVRVANGLDLPDNGRKLLIDALPQAWAKGKPDLDMGATILEQIQRGQFRAGARLPFSQHVMFEEGATKALEMVGNGISAIGKLGMKFKPVANFIAKHPTAKYWPKKAWLKISGDAAKADVLGNAKLTELWLHQKNFQNEVGFESQKFLSRSMQEQAALLNGLTDADRAMVMRAGQVIAEDPKMRKNVGKLISRGHVNPITNTPLDSSIVAYSDFIRATDDEMLVLGQKWNLQIDELTGDTMKHVGRQFSDELADFFAKRPDARKAWMGSRARMEMDNLKSGLLDMEKGRKLKDMDIVQSEKHLREQFKEFGVPEDMPIWEPDAAKLMRTRMESMHSQAIIRNYSSVATQVYGDAEPTRLAAAMRGVTTKMDDVERATKEALDEALLVQSDFQAGRTAVRQGARQAERGVVESGIAGARAQELRAVTDEAQRGTKIAYEMGRDAESRAVVVAESLRDEATDLLHATDGAVEARQALKDARAMLKDAKKSQDLAEPVAILARALGMDVPEGMGEDVVAVAKEFVRFAQNEIKGNPAIKNADQALRVANKMLSEARHVAAKVESKEIAGHIDDLLLSAEQSAKLKGTGAKYLTHALKNELKKVRTIAGEVNDFYQWRSLGVPLKDLKHKHRGVRAIRSAMSVARKELRKDAPAALHREFDRVWQRAIKLEQTMDRAQGAVAKDVASGVNKRVAAAKKAHKNANINELAIEDKVIFVRKAIGEAGILRPHGQIDALELYKSNNVKLPDSIEDLTSLATTFLDEAGGKEVMKFAKARYWKHFETKTQTGKMYDAIKRIYQKSTLARVSSLARDFVGTTSQGMLSGNTGHLKGALDDLGGLAEWKQGYRAGKETPDYIHRLRAEGVLQTTKGEALEGGGQLVGKPLLGNVEESGVVGGTLRSLGAEKTGKAVGEKIGVMNDARVYYEELNRVATYKKAVQEGMTHEQASEEVLKFWGNFSELSKMERVGLNRVLFFWSWMARSVPTAIKTMAAHPVKARLALTAIAGNIQGSDSMPEWMQRMGGWTLGQGEDGNYSVINLGNSTYFSPTMSALQSDFVKNVGAGRLDRAAGELGREIAGSGPPPLTAAYERLTERDSFSGDDWWKDKRNKAGTNQKAPAGMYWLEGTVFGDLLGIEVKSEATSDGDSIKQVYMDPETANLMSLIPGLEPFMTDVSSFVDPRKQDVAGTSLAKGVLRSVGLPKYEIAATDEQTRQLYKFQAALAKSVDAMPGNSLKSYYGKNVTLNDDSARGREIKQIVDSLFDTAKKQGHDDTSAKIAAYSQIASVYPEEARILKLNLRLSIFRKLAKAPAKAREEKVRGGLGLR